MWYDGSSESSLLHVMLTDGFLHLLLLRLELIMQFLFKPIEGSNVLFCCYRIYGAATGVQHHTVRLHGTRILEYSECSGCMQTEFSYSVKKTSVV